MIIIHVFSQLSCISISVFKDRRSKGILLGEKFALWSIKGGQTSCFTLLNFEHTAQHFDLLPPSYCTYSDRATAWLAPLISYNLTRSTVKILPEAHHGPELSGMRAKREREREHSLVLKFHSSSCWISLWLGFLPTAVYYTNSLACHWSDYVKPVIRGAELSIKQWKLEPTDSHPQTEQPNKPNQSL